MFAKHFGTWRLMTLVFADTLDQHFLKQNLTRHPPKILAKFTCSRIGPSQFVPASLFCYC